MMTLIAILSILVVQALFNEFAPPQNVGWSILYRSWSMMKNRCLNKNADQAKYYIGKTIHKPWIDSFEEFLNDMGEKPTPKKEYSIERKNNNEGYYPWNCIWADKKTQSNNRRKRNSVK